MARVNLREKPILVSFVVLAGLFLTVLFQSVTYSNTGLATESLVDNYEASTILTASGYETTITFTEPFTGAITIDGLRTEVVSQTEVTLSTDSQPFDIRVTTTQDSSVGDQGIIQEEAGAPTLSTCDTTSGHCEIIPFYGGYSISFDVANWGTGLVSQAILTFADGHEVSFYDAAATYDGTTLTLNVPPRFFGYDTNATLKLSNFDNSFQEHSSIYSNFLVVAVRPDPDQDEDSCKQGIYEELTNNRGYLPTEALNSECITSEPSSCFQVPFPSIGYYESNVYQLNCCMNSPGEKFFSAEGVCCPIDAVGVSGGRCITYATTTESPRCGDIINSPGTYTLTENTYPNYSGDSCLKIQSSNVVLDCQGHTIDGNNAANSKAIFISPGLNNIVVKNCVINEFRTGILTSSLSNSNLSDNIISNSGDYGIKMIAYTANIENNVINGNTISGSGFASIALEEITGIIQNNLIYNNLFNDSLILDSSAGLGANTWYNPNHLSTGSQTNIIGELRILGNYYGSPNNDGLSEDFSTCPNWNSDAVCDDPIDIAPNNRDQTPLTLLQTPPVGNLIINPGSCSESSPCTVTIGTSGTFHPDSQILVRNASDSNPIKIILGASLTITENTISFSSTQLPLGASSLWIENDPRGSIEAGVFTVTTNSGAYCGDGIINPELGEACDDGILNGQSCGVYGGPSCIYCSTSCENITQTAAFCGDGLVQSANETCDGGNLAGATCTSQGFDSGTLSCQSDCQAFDTSACIFNPADTVTCGDTISAPGNYVLGSSANNFGNTCITITSSDVTLNCQGRTIDGFGINSGILIQNAGSTIQNVEVSNCIIKEYDKGIYVLGENNVTIWNNTIYSSNTGVLLESSEYSTVRNNVIRNNFDGLKILSLSSKPSSNNLVRTNFLRFNDRGITVEQSGSGLVESNVVYDNFLNNSQNILVSGGVGSNTYYYYGLPYGTNIVGGEYFGGNFYTSPGGLGISQTCNVNPAGLCVNQVNFAPQNVDYAPLSDMIPPNLLSVFPSSASPLGGYSLVLNTTRFASDYNITMTYFGTNGTFAKEFRVLDVDSSAYTLSGDLVAFNVPLNLSRWSAVGRPQIIFSGERFSYDVGAAAIFDFTKAVRVVSASPSSIDRYFNSPLNIVFNVENYDDPNLNWSPSYNLSFYNLVFSNGTLGGSNYSYSGRQVTIQIPPGDYSMGDAPITIIDNAGKTASFSGLVSFYTPIPPDDGGDNDGGSSRGGSSGGGGGSTRAQDRIYEDNKGFNDIIRVKVEYTSPYLLRLELKDAADSLYTGDGVIYNVYEIISNRNNDEITKAEITFRVNDLWMKNNNIDPKSIKVYKRDKNRLNWEKISTSRSQTSYTAYTTGFSYFAVVANLDDTEEEGGSGVDIVTPPSSDDREPELPPPVFDEEESNRFWLYVWAGVGLFIVILAIVTLLLIKKHTRVPDKKKVSDFANHETPSSLYGKKPLIIPSKLSMKKVVKKQLKSVDAKPVHQGFVPTAKEIEQLKSYVDACLGKGFNLLRIRNKLIGAGWNKEAVDHLLVQENQEFIRKKKNRKEDLKHYVTICRQKKISDEKIRLVLQKAGWRENDIEEALTDTSADFSDLAKKDL